MPKKLHYDWNTIQKFYDNGGTFQEITDEFGPCASAIYKAFDTGRLGNRRSASENAKIGGVKKTRVRDWVAIQAFYDEGNSWAKVTAKFGISSNNIQLAIKDGLLRGRTRSESFNISLDRRGLKRHVWFRNCKHCSTQLYKSQRAYCSLECKCDYIWENKTLPLILQGKSGPNSLKTYLIKKSPYCVECGLGSEWNGKHLVLQMDHINGDSDDNRIENVRLLCPNCHTQTPNFGIKNKGARSKRNLYMKKMRDK